MPPKSHTTHRKILMRACLRCRTRKIRCDTAQPRCKVCANLDRECVYQNEVPRKRYLVFKLLLLQSSVKLNRATQNIDCWSRPTFARIHELERANSILQSFIKDLKSSPVHAREGLLASFAFDDEQSGVSQTGAGLEDHNTPERNNVRDEPENASILSDSEFEDPDVTHFVSIDDSGNPGNFGPSSALHVLTNTDQSPKSGHLQDLEHRRNRLVANAALQRQAEHRISTLPEVAGLRTELALHLLNVHWARQHHTFLLTYRPVIMRDIQNHGCYSSPFLLNAIFACASKFSDHARGQENPFFDRCEEILAKDSLLIRPGLPTVIGLLLLGSTYNARGETSKGWLFTGYAVRMIYDLGLHLDPQGTTSDPEEIEIRRRVFWGAFICDKLQSLYLGRPPAINLSDYQVSREFLDTFEENEPFMSSAALPSPMYSVSTFRQLCSLSKIMTVIINRLYAVRATFSNALSSLQMVKAALQKWKENLPSELQMQPWSESAQTCSPPNVMNLHGIYHSLVILLYRPFISDGHLRSTTVPQHSWEQCTNAANKISAIVRAYKDAHGLTSAPYLLAYSVYVACTIHVRNAAGEGNGFGEHTMRLIANIECLKAMCVVNPGIQRPLDIIKRLIARNNINLDASE